MRFKDVTKDAVCELLFYLAENEEFPSLAKLKTFTKSEVAEIIKEIAFQLKGEMADEGPRQKLNSANFDLSSKALSLISCLSPREEQLLFKSFKLL
ncbi:MAG: hypothetical protein HYU99_05950 [Deltaproteobacteria bacterium]|nr:hypothetical protein [Deltaproteobacteria bacterium]